MEISVTGCSVGELTLLNCIHIRYRSKETTAYAREQVCDHSNVMRDYHARRPARSIEFHARRPARSIERITRAISRTTWPARSIPRKPLGNYVRNIKGGFQTQYVQSIVKQFGQNEFSGIFLQHCSIVEEVLWRTLPRIYSIPAVQIAQDQSRDWSRQWSCTYVCDNSRFSRDRMHNSMMTLLFFREIDSDGAWRLSW